jgi:hypothetical protein
MKRPPHQHFIVCAGWVLATVVAAGSFLDAISNPMSLIPPSLTYYGSVTVIVSMILAHFYLRKYPVRWVAHSGEETKVSGFNIRIGLILLGIGFLLWVPRVFESPDRGVAGGSTPLTADTVGESQRGTPSLDLNEAAIAASSAAFSPVTMKEFFQTMFNLDVTSIQKEEFLARHLGRRVIWEGTVVDGSDESRFEKILKLVIALEESEAPLLASFEFTPAYRDDLLALKSRQKVKLTGVLRESTYLHARLGDSRILRTWPLEVEQPRISSGLGSPAH